MTADEFFADNERARTMSYDGHHDEDYVARFNDELLDFKLRIRMYLKPSEHGHETRHFIYLLVDWFFSFCFMVT